MRSIKDEVHAGKLTADALQDIGSGGGHAGMAGGVIYQEQAEKLLGKIEETVKNRFLDVIRNGCEMVRSNL